MIREKQRGEETDGGRGSSGTPSKGQKREGKREGGSRGNGRGKGET